MEEIRKRFEITTQPIDVAEVVARVSAPDCGAIVTFIGAVRDNNYGRQVEYLEYDAYSEMAEEQLELIGSEIVERWPATRGVSIVHRIGRQNVGEISVVIAIAAGHRAGTFDAARYAIERIKEIVPIWKKEVSPDGAYWIEGPESQSSNLAKVPEPSQG
jgi:molybdopterin synthase catalytic subunit